MNFILAQNRFGLVSIYTNSSDYCSTINSQYQHYFYGKKKGKWVILKEYYDYCRDNRIYSISRLYLLK